MASLVYPLFGSRLGLVVLLSLGLHQGQALGAPTLASPTNPDDEVVSLYSSFRALITQLPRGGEAEQYLWLDGEYLRIIAQGVPSETPPRNARLTDLLGHLVGVRVTRSGGFLGLAIYLDSEWSSVTAHVPYAKFRGIKLPQVLKFHLLQRDDSLEVFSIGSEDPQMLINLPLLPDEVTFRRIQMGLSDGRTLIEAGVLDNHVDVFARLQLTPMPKAKVDWGLTILSNLFNVFVRDPLISSKL